MKVTCFCPGCHAPYAVAEAHLARTVRCERCSKDFVLERSPQTDGRPAEAPAEGTSASLIFRVQADEPEAWERLVDLYSPLVYRWCRAAGIQADDAADVVQEVFAAVAGHVRDFRRDRPGDSFRAWLRTIARNKINDHFRRLRGRAQAEGGTEALQRMAGLPDPLSESPDGDDQGHDEDFLTRRAVEIVRGEVEDRTWQAFCRVAVNGQDTAQVAADLGMQVAAVYEAKYRVRRRIREVLESLE